MPPSKRWVTVVGPTLTEDIANDLSRATGRVHVYIKGRFKWKEPNGTTHKYEFCSFTIGNPEAVFTCHHHNGPVS
jgi:hypothetical protein